MLSLHGDDDFSIAICLRVLLFERCYVQHIVFWSAKSTTNKQTTASLTCAVFSGGVKHDPKSLCNCKKWHVEKC